MATENLKTGKMNFFGNLKNLWVACLFVGIFLMLSGNVSAYTVIGGGVCNCGDGTAPHPNDACKDCSAALNDDRCRQVFYIGFVKIENYRGTCINNPRNFNNKIFDCQGNTIDGTGQGYGIYMFRKNSNTIKKCIITDFWEGIFLWRSFNNTLIDNVVNNNQRTGIHLLNSSRNTLIDNEANNNQQRSGIYLLRSVDNTISNNTVEYNRNGIILLRSVGNRLFDNMVNNNHRYGIYLDMRSLNNSLSYNKVNYNWKGISLWRNSRFNYLHSNIVCFNNWLDIYNRDYQNWGYENMCDNTDVWNDINAVGCTYKCVSI